MFLLEVLQQWSGTLLRQPSPIFPPLSSARLYAGRSWTVSKNFCRWGYSSRPNLPPVSSTTKLMTTSAALKIFDKPAWQSEQSLFASLASEIHPWSPARIIGAEMAIHDWKQSIKCASERHLSFDKLLYKGRCKGRNCTVLYKKKASSVTSRSGILLVKLQKGLTNSADSWRAQPTPQNLFQAQDSDTSAREGWHQLFRMIARLHFMCGTARRISVAADWASTLWIQGLSWFQI